VTLPKGSHDVTKHHLVSRRLPARALTPLLLLLAAAGGSVGCAGKPAQLRLTSLENDATFVQQFSKAYIGKGAVGGTEVVLVDEQAVPPRPDADGDAMTAASSSSTGSAVRQVMHLKVLWKPQRGTKQSHPSYTNAGLRWYVLGDGGRDVLEYSGAGFVALTETAAGTQVTIRNATLKPVGTPRGSLTDPVGPARLTGTFIATKSPQRVSALLAEVKTAVDGAAIRQASAR
jgi:hypothetical protein